MTYRRELFLSLPEHEKTIESDTPGNSFANVSKVSGKEQAIGTAQRYEAERKDMSVETSNQMSSEVQMGDERREDHKDAPVADEHVLETVLKADDQRVEDNDGG